VGDNELYLPKLWSLPAAGDVARLDDDERLCS
jgi:hypothetical protein